MNWQPIETAPKKGGILAYIPDWQGCQVIYWASYKGCWETASGENVRGTPSHWMPLPPAPESKDE